MLSELAFVELQLKVALCPWLIVAGFAPRLTVGFVAALCTVTVTVAVSVAPPVNVAVAV
jgi:hypothetical protein